MKKIIIISLAIIAISISVEGQISFEKTYNENYKPFQLENGEVKLMSLNKDQKELKIFNLDETLWKTIPLNVPTHSPKEHYLYNIESISIKTFNNDDLIEVMYFCYKLEEDLMITGEGTVNKQIYDLAIVNEQGKELLRVSNAIDYKLFLKDKKNKKVSITTIDRSMSKSYVLFKF